MKTMKKLSIVALVCVMCVLLGVMVSAETAVEYTVTPSASELCVSSSDQKVTLTVEIDSASTVGLVGMTVTFQDGCDWSIDSITNSTLGFKEDNYNLSTGEIVWITDKDYAVDYENVTLLASIVVNIPANTPAGDYVISVNDIEVGNDGGYTMLNAKSTTASTTITIGHDWEDATYSWSEDGKTCTAERVCARDESHKETENVNATGAVKTPATCTVKGWTTYTANFEAEWAVDGQTKTIQDVATNAANHESAEIEYVDNAGDTHTVKHVCCGATEVPVEHTYNQENDTKCVCGAVKPVTNVSVTYKGAALANAYTVEGQVVTVTFASACKIGYWDATNNKYVAIAAVANPDGSYSFTIPAGITEVLLVVKGDANTDGSITMADATRTRAAYNSKITLNAEQQFAANVNTDDTVTIADATRIRAAFNNKVVLTWG